MAAMPGAPGAPVTTCRVTNPQQLGLLTARQLGPRAASPGTRRQRLGVLLRAARIQGQGAQAVHPDEEGSGQRVWWQSALGNAGTVPGRGKDPGHATWEQKPRDMVV